ALPRHYVLEEDPRVAERCPMLPTIASLIGHAQIRHRGTIGGSLAHADPVAELSLAATALGAEIEARGPGGARTLEPSSFFLDYLTTSLEPTELLTEVRFPALPAGAGWSVQEFTRRHGDFAIVATAVVLEAAGGVCRGARVAVAGGGPAPCRSAGAGAARVAPPGGGGPSAAAAGAAEGGATPEETLRFRAHPRRKMARVFVRRALEEAATRLGKEA